MSRQIGSCRLLSAAVSSEPNVESIGERSGTDGQRKREGQIGLPLFLRRKGVAQEVSPALPAGVSEIAL